MAGSYPDPYGQRIEWDRDGTAVIFWNGTSTDLTLGTKQTCNGEGGAGDGARLYNAGIYYAWIFPKMMTITTIFSCGIAGSQTPTGVIEHSLDTTNGVDGTWVNTRPSGTNYMLPVQSTLYYRQPTAGGYWNSSPLPLSVKGIRNRCTSITGNTRLGAMHLYGYPTPTTGDWLLLWHPTLDQPLSTTPVLTDLGDVARGSVFKTFSFRVKNMSATLTAQGITLSRDALTDGSPTIVSMMTLQHNATGYATTANVGNLAPGAISAVCDVRIDPSATAPTGIWAPRINAVATTWT